MKCPRDCPFVKLPGQALDGRSVRLQLIGNLIFHEQNKFIDIWNQYFIYSAKKCNIDLAILLIQSSFTGWFHIEQAQNFVQDIAQARLFLIKGFSGGFDEGVIIPDLGLSNRRCIILIGRWWPCRFLSPEIAMTQYFFIPIYAIEKWYGRFILSIASKNPSIHLLFFQFTARFNTRYLAWLVTQAPIAKHLKRRVLMLTDFFP